MLLRNIADDKNRIANCDAIPLNLSTESLRRYAQPWSQLDMVDGTVCRKYHPGPTSDTIVVPVLLEALQQQALSMSQAADH